MKVFETLDNTKIKRVSRWIKLRVAYNITSRHSLYDYAEKIGETENCLDCFVYNGKKYALNQFIRMGSFFSPHVTMFYENDELHHLSGYDAENYFNPLLLELDDCGEYVRLYVDVN